MSEKWTVDRMLSQMYGIRGAYRHLEEAGDFFTGVQLLKDEYMRLASAIIKKEVATRLEQAETLLRSTDPIKF